MTEAKMNTAKDLFADSGEMGTLMSEFDWSATSLGAVENWPQSLRTTVSICLKSRFPMVIWWGQDLVVIYNDAWRPVLGATKHPQALGRPGKEVWPEIWDIIGSQLEGVLTTGQATWSDDMLLLVDRYGYTEEAYFTYSYSPIILETGQIGGAFSAVSETTLRVLGERRLQTLRDLAAQAGQAKTVEQACQMAIQTIASNSIDIPFALIYLVESGIAVLYESTLVDTSAGQDYVDLTAADETIWSLSEVVQSRDAILVEVPQHFVALGPWAFPKSALVLPLHSVGQDSLTGLLVVGVNPCRELDDDYRNFYHMVAGYITTALANARAHEEERKRAEALAELDRAKTIFFSNISHEFRTPLTLMLGPLEDTLINPSSPLPALERSQLEMVQRNGLRLLKLVNTLLDFSRIEAGRVQATYEPTDLAILTIELASVFRSAIERAGLQLTVNCPPLDELVYVDREMWEKIVLNLLSNALKFTFVGEISVSLQPADDLTLVEDSHEKSKIQNPKFIALSVRDTGTGIPAEEIPHLFERFHRVQGARGRTYEGSGIGLSLVQELVKLHGGTIHVSSVVDEGTCFTVLIPTGSAHLPSEQISTSHTLTSTPKGAKAYVEEALRWLPTEDGDTPPLSPSDTTERPNSPTPRILLADDNADMRDYVQRLLSQQYDVAVVSNGTSALSVARTQLPDLILSDVMMPGLNGFELLRELRSDPYTREIPVILLSARAGEEAKIEGLQAGADDYLIKPFSARELLARVSATLELARLRRAAVQQERAIRTEVEAERQRLQDIFVQVPAIVSVIRASDQVYLLANSALCQLLGNRQLVGKSVREAHPELEGQGFFELFDRVCHTGEVFVGKEMPAMLDRCHDGNLSQGFFNFVYQPMRDAEGNFETILHFGVEVTDSVEARQLVEKSVNRISQLQKMTATLAQALTTDEINEILLDRMLAALNAGRGWIGQINAQEDEVEIVASLGYTDSDLEPFRHTPLTTSIPITDAIRTRQLVLVRSREEYRVKYPDIADQYIASKSHAIATIPLIAKNRVVGALGLSFAESRDFTEADCAFMLALAQQCAQALERARLYEAEQIAREQAETANRVKDEFLAVLSHELRTPLNPILGWVKLLRTRTFDAAKIDYALLTIERNAQLQAQLIEDLLDVSRILQGKLSMSIYPVNLASTIAAAMQTLRLAVEAKSIQLTTVLEPNIGSVSGDAGRLQQVIWNLLSNAVKFTPAGGRVEIRLERVAEYAEITVSDTGKGIESDFLPYVFDYFRQADSTTTRKFGGLGLGLAIVRHLVELHGGTVRADSPGEGQGATFTVKLPLMTTADEPNQDIRESNSSVNLQGLRILVVDDDTDTRDLITFTLEQYGATVIAFASASVALNALPQEKPDLLVSDIGMPEMDGYMLIRQVRTLPEQIATIPAIALTAYAGETNQEQVLAAGFQMHIAKPVEPDRLAEAIANLLGI